MIGQVKLYYGDCFLVKNLSFVNHVGIESLGLIIKSIILAATFGRRYYTDNAKLGRPIFLVSNVNILRMNQLIKSILTISVECAPGLFTVQLIRGVTYNYRTGDSTSVDSMVDDKNVMSIPKYCYDLMIGLWKFILSLELTKLIFAHRWLYNGIFTPGLIKII